MKKILLAVDGSDSCNKAVTSVVELSYLIDDMEITVLNVVEDVVSPQTINKKEIKQEFERHKKYEETSQEIVQSCANNFNEECKVRRIVREGNPSTEICKVADEGDYDLVVVADMGRSAIKKFLLGSTTERVVKHCNKSVMVVK